MFGQHKARRKENRSFKQQSEMQREINRLNSQKTTDPLTEARSQQDLTNQLAEDQKQRDLKARQEGKAYSDEVLGRKYEGLDKLERSALQESANSQINRDIQGYENKLLAQQGRRGVKGGAAYAQRADLARMGVDAQQQTQRDLTILDKDRAMQKMAQAYNIEQGEVGQNILRNQMAKDSLESYDQKKYQKWLADQANKLFQRV